MRYIFTTLTGLTLIAILCSAVSVMAASISLVPTGNGMYTIQGSGMDGIAGIQFDIAYTAAQMGSPTIQKGNLVGDAMFAANTNIPGVIKVAIISTASFNGNGTVATISFANHSEGSNNPSISSYSLINSNGSPISPDSSLADTGSNGLSTTAPFSESSTGTTATTTTTSASVSTGTTMGLGNVSMPSEPKENVPPKTETPEHEVMPTSAPNSESQQTAPPAEPIREAEKAVEPEKPQEQKIITYSSVLDRFRTYQGEQSPIILSALFSKPVTEHVTQEPAIAITNGKDTVKVTFVLPHDEKTAPNFALTGAKMVSLTNNKEHTSNWIIEAIPNLNSLKSSITMITGSQIVEYPLTVVPAAKEITDKETDFALFLKDSGAKTPRRDLNGDGIHDYQDNYIYTAYYLLLQQNKEKPKKSKPIVQ